MTEKTLALVFFLTLPGPTPALADERASGVASASPVTWGAYLDTYYAYDFNGLTGSRNPSAGVLFTQPAQSNDFNVNLAFVEAKVAADRVRGRLALQTGTSVPPNYNASDPSILTQVIQEAYAGYRIADGLWVDGGIYFSHIGFESWISRDNWTYSHSMSSDFSPYYQAGVRVSYQLSTAWSAQLHLLNGWGNIAENNPGKGVGLQLAFTPTSKLSLTYNNYVGNEAGFGLRFFNDFIARFRLTDSWQVAVCADYGIQQSAAANGFSSWYQATLVSQLRLSPKIAIAGRIEGFSDSNQVVATTLTSNGFVTAGASANLDVQLHPILVWRTEVRGFWSLDPVFVSSAGASSRDGFGVTSFTISL